METIEDLRKRVKEECFNEEELSINDNWKALYLGYGIEKGLQDYTVFYFERGERDVIFKTALENDAVNFFYKTIDEEESLKLHFLIEFKLSHLRDKCKEELSFLGLDLKLDEVYYNGLNDIRYRIFLKGCGLEKAKKVIEKYQTSE